MEKQTTNSVLREGKIMAIKGDFYFDVVITGLENGGPVSEERKLYFTLFDVIASRTTKEDVAKEGALELVAKNHPAWTELRVESCVEV